MMEIMKRCRSVAGKEDRIYFDACANGNFVWVHAYQDDKCCSIKLSADDLLDVVSQLGLVAEPCKHAENSGSRMASLKEIHAALGRMIGE